MKMKAAVEVVLRGQPARIPETPGVYAFRKRGEFLYVGKAADLKKRLRSYFRKNVGAKIQRMTAEATGLEWLETESEIDALLKEAELVKKYRPRYNVLLRDDKNYFYVGVTKEEFPRLFTTHQPGHSNFTLTSPHDRGADVNVKFTGPFTNGAALKIVLRLLRRIFPYCTCKKVHKRRCLSSELGLCPGFCCIKNYPTGKRSLASCGKEYQKNIRNVITVLGGRKKRLLGTLKRVMKTTAKKEDFELAAKLRDQICGLENIFQHRHVLEVEPPIGGSTSSKFPWGKVGRNIQELLGTRKKISRIEGYDVSNISGTEATGSMAVFIDGLPAKSEYRKFRIKTARPVREVNYKIKESDILRDSIYRKKNSQEQISNGVNKISDVDMLKEVIGRRLAHQEWKYPDLMLIDGGKPQLNAARAALKFQATRSKFQVPIAALAKREEELYVEGRRSPIPLKNLPPDTAFFFQRVRDEAHRFAKKYHLKRREMGLRTY